MSDMRKVDTQVTVSDMIHDLLGIVLDDKGGDTNEPTSLYNQTYDKVWDLLESVNEKVRDA